MHNLLQILILPLFTSVLVSARHCDPADPLIKFLRTLKNGRKECASYLGELTTRTVLSTTSVDASPSTFYTEIDHETTIGSLDVARLTNTVKHTETKTVTSAVYDSTSYSMVIVTVTSVPPPQTRTSTAIQTITAGGTTTYYTITVTIFQTTAAAATLLSAATSEVLVTTYVISIATTSIKSSPATSAISSLLVPLSDYSTETITASSLLSSAPLISTKPIFPTVTGSNLTSTPLQNSATGTGRASSLLSPLPVTIGSTMASPGLGSYTTETGTAPSLLSSAPIPSTFISPITVIPGTGTSPSVPYALGCTVYTTTITRPGILSQPSTFITLGSIYNTSISTRTTNSSAPFTLSPSPSPSPPGPVMNRGRRFNIPKSSSTVHSNAWISHTNAVMTAAPIILKNGMDTVRLYERHLGDTSSACSCIMPYLISQPEVTQVVTETIPPRMIWVTKTKVFTKVRIDGTTTLTSEIVQHTTKYVTKFHTKIKEAVTTKSIAAPGIANSAVIVTVTSTTTVQTPVTSTITQYTTIAR